MPAFEMVASWDDWLEFEELTRQNPGGDWDTFDGLEVRVGLIRAPDYKGAGTQVKCSEDAYRLVRGRLSLEPREMFLTINLDNKHRIDNVYVVGQGRGDTVEVHPTQVFQAALLSNAQAIILAHNHPSGDPEPSREDLRLTRRLAGAGEVLGIPVLDHLVVGGGRYVSLADRGLLEASVEEALAAAGR